MGKLIAISLGVLGLIAVAGLLGENPDESTSNVDSSAVSLPTDNSSLAPADNVLTTSGLPTYDPGSTELADVLVAEGLLKAYSLNAKIDAKMSEKEVSELNNLRAIYGLPAGGINQEFWEKIFETAAPEVVSGTDIAFEGINLPTPAIPIGVDVPASQPIKTARYTVGFKSDPPSIVNWLRSNNQDLEGWRWCEEDSTASSEARFFWWKRNGEMLSLDVRPMGGGRVDLLLAVEANAFVSDCSGAERDTSELDVLSTNFRWRDAGLDWEWRPEGDYQNNSDTTIVYFEVAYILTSQDLFTSLNFREQIETELAPGKKTKIMASKWFPLSVLDSTANSLGYSLSYGAGATFRSEVRYIVFEDGTTAGSPT